MRPEGLLKGMCRYLEVLILACLDGCLFTHTHLFLSPHIIYLPLLLAGLFLLCAGLYLLWNEDKNDKAKLDEMTGGMHAGRYMIVMMGFFAVYA